MSFFLVFKLFLLSFLISSLYTFNYQTVEHWRYLKRDRTSSKSFFGYSLAVHRSSLLVGAPRDHSSHDTIARRGAVWKCNFDNNEQCQRLPFRLDGEANVRVGTSFDNKTDQWLGASLAANDVNVVAGTPFLKHRIKDGSNIDYEIPGGALIGKIGPASSLSENTQIFSPSFFNWHSRNYNQEGYGEFGFQIAISERPERLIVSSPGSFYFRGGVHSLPIFDENFIDTRHPFTSPHYRWRDAGWLRYPSNYSSNEYDDWCYRGYALAVGNFNDDENQEIVVSIPKLDNYRGAVEIINSNLDETSIRILNGTQMGEYFGSSLCVVDLNNDGLDDLIVGAPLYTVKKDGRILPDAGRVDIFYQTAKHQLIRKDSIEGTREGGRFGHALTNLGDIDQDGFNDVAISSPFGDQGVDGKVYVYRGSKNGLITKASQTLEAKGLKGFGWSLQGRFDYDNNTYADLAVGSVHSDRVAIILSRPVLRLQVRLEQSSPEIPLNCTLNSVETCFTLSFCIYLLNENYPFVKRNELTYAFHLDKNKDFVDRRVAFRQSDRSVRRRQMKLSNRICHEYSLYIKENINDKLRPIRLHIDFSLSSKFDNQIVPPILDPNSNEFGFNIPIQKDCGSDNVCVPNLQISTSLWPNDYKVGLTSKILLNFNVTNKGENAYDTQCFIHLPTGVEYVRANSNSLINLYCNLMKPSDRIIVCQLGNPLVANGHISIEIQMSVNNYSSIENDELIFLLNVTSDNGNSTNLSTEIRLPVLSSPELVLIGVAKPEQIVSDSFDSNLFRYSSTTTTMNELQILHTYTLHNKGPSDAKRTEVKFMWPMLPLNGFNEQTPLLTNVDLPTIIRVSEPKSKNDRCFVFHSSIYQLPNVDENETNPFFDRLRSTVTNQIESSSNSSSLFCHGSICKTFICQIDTLPIGQSVLIQLKATLKSNLFRSKFDRTKSFFIVSNGSAQVREIPMRFSRSNSTNFPFVQLKLETQIPPLVERSSQHWLWLIGLSITVGVILLIILVGVLWCCGFFKRNRPKYPIKTNPNEINNDPYRLPSVEQFNRYPFRSMEEQDELSIESNEDTRMMIENPLDRIPIVVPEHSSQFVQQQNRTQFVF